MSPPLQPAIHRFELIVPAEAIDENGHTNNVEYVRWMQQVAVSHATAAGGAAATLAAAATWVAREHHIEYLRPTFAGDRLAIFTWISELNRASVIRRYRFVRPSDGILAARAHTCWVFVCARTGRPMPVHPAVSSRFGILPSAQDPSVADLLRIEH